MLTRPTKAASLSIYTSLRPRALHRKYRGFPLMERQSNRRDGCDGMVAFGGQGMWPEVEEVAWLLQSKVRTPRRLSIFETLPTCGLPIEGYGETSHITKDHLRADALDPEEFADAQRGIHAPLPVAIGKHLPKGVVDD